MTICFALSLVLVFSIIMCLSVQDNAVKLHSINCKVDEPFNSAYVTPVIEQPSEVTGCHSSNPDSEDQEIHVLNLLRSSIHSFEARNEYIPSISLDVRPRWKEKYPASTIVILLSASPVMWQMKLHHVTNSTSFHVIVNKPSHVVPSISVPVSRRKLPPLKRLSSWIESHHGAVTSYSLIPVANEITLFIGIDTSSAQECNFSSQAQSIHVKASFVQLQPATGCSVKTPIGFEKSQNILYIIELNSNAFGSDIMVHLHRANADFPQKNLAEHNVTLVLKCHAPVEWIIESTGIQGLLRIIAEHPVHVQTNPLYITTMVQEKVLSSATLLNTVQNTFGPIHTYVKTSKANRINIIIREKMKYTLESSSSKDTSSLQSSLSQEKSSASSEVIFTDDQKKPNHDNLSKVATEESLSLLLAKQMILKCASDKISIIFPLQETLSIFTTVVGTRSKLSFVSLLDVNCKAKQNESHIMLQSNWHDCGTRRVLNGGIEYHNQVQFITTMYASDKDSSIEQKHLPTDDDDYISEDGSGSDDISSNHFKCCNEEHIIYPLPFSCSPSAAKTDLDITHSSEQFEMKLFSKKDFQQSFSPQSFPLNVVVHDHLFAETSIKADYRLCIVVDECWLSEEAESNQNSGRKSILIKQGCPTDLSVDILSKSHCGNLSPDVDNYKMRFSFQLSEEFINQQLYLHCRLASCAMRDSKQLNSKQCIISENFCLKQSLRPYLDSLQGKKFTMLVQGPIHVISKSRVEKDKDVLSFVSPESSSSPENFVVDYSFDKLTGNNKKNPVSQELVFVGLSTEAVVGIAFASFIIGAGLMATLWLIHMYTEPARRSKQSRKQTVNQYQTGGQLNFDRPDGTDKAAPCSLKPMSVQICS